MTPEPLHLSVVLPCFNEGAGVSAALAAVYQELRTLGRPFEMVAVDDGSADDTAAQVQAFAAEHPGVRCLALMKNFGQAQAYQAGFDAARGRYVILFSADLEIPAGAIGEVVAGLEAGADFVNTHRQGRWDGFRAWRSRVANGLLNAVSGLELADRGSGLKGMRREIAQSLRLYGEWHRFLPDYATLFTSRIREIPVPFQDRQHGASSYRGRIKTLAVLLDLPTVAFTLWSQRKPFPLLPGRLFGFTGLVVGLLGGGVTSYLVALKVFFGASLADRPLFLISILLSILGVIMIMVGLLGELAMQIANRPPANVWGCTSSLPT